MSEAVDEIEQKDAPETKPKKKRTPKRMDAEALKASIIARKEKAAADGKEYRGVEAENVQFDTLAFNEETKRQCVTINTVDAEGKPDGDTRVVATSDLQHVRHSQKVSKEISKAKNNARRREKREAAKEK